METKKLELELEIHECIPTEPHSCPFEEQINDNYSQEYCTCCEECEQECVDAI